jgi:hypothetical protein
MLFSSPYSTRPGPSVNNFFLPGSMSLRHSLPHVDHLLVARNNRPPNLFLKDPLLEADLISLPLWDTMARGRWQQVSGGRSIPLDRRMVRRREQALSLIPEERGDEAADPQS